MLAFDWAADCDVQLATKTVCKFAVQRVFLEHCAKSSPLNTRLG
jgi:hypothetical protein